MKVLYIQLLEGSQKVMHRLYVGNVARNPVIVHRQLALLTEGETDFRKLSQRSIARIAQLLNERPWQTLGMHTPKDKFNQLCVKSY